MPTKKRTHQEPPEFEARAGQPDLTSGKPRRVIDQELGVGLSTLTKDSTLNARTRIHPFQP